MNRVTVLMTLSVGCALAQPRIEFEAASIKPSPGGQTWMVGGPETSDPGRISYENVTLRRLIMLGFGVDADQVVGPKWQDSERYTIAAKVPPQTTRAQFVQMLRRLVEDRLRLRTHIEPKEFPAYDLVTAAGGPKGLTPAASAPSEPTPEPVAPGPRGTCPASRPGIHFQDSSFPRDGDGCARFNNFSIDQLAASLEIPIAIVEAGVGSGLVVHVVDKTGIQGKYDFTLRYHFYPSRPGLPDVTDFGTSLFASLERQLGLRLVKSRATLDVVVVGSVEKTPTEE